MKKTTSDRSKWSSPNPTAPVIESRVPFFLPILRTTYNSKRQGRVKYETPWGWIELLGPVLTQEHRSILDMAMSMAIEKKMFKETGGMSLVFDTHKVKKALGTKYSGGGGHKRFLQRLEEMRIVRLTVQNNKTGTTRISGILDHFSYQFDPKKPDQFAGGIKTARSRIGDCLHEIRVSPSFMEFFREDLRVHYDPLVPEIVAIPDGTIRAIVLFFITHSKNCRFSIRQVMEIIGAITEGQSERMKREIMAKPEKFKADLERFGITIEGGNLCYERHPKVFFTNPPPPSSTGAVIDAEQAPEPISIKTALEATLGGKRNPESPEK